VTSDLVEGGLGGLHHNPPRLSRESVTRAMLLVSGHLGIAALSAPFSVFFFR